MSRVQVTLNTAAVRALLLQGDGIMAECGRQAEGIARRAGNGYACDPYAGKNRGNVRVTAESFAAKRDNLRNNTLLKAIRGTPQSG